MMRKFLFLTMLFAGLAAAAPRDPAYPEQVQVRFESLWWVGAKTVLPRVVAGQLVAPPDEACDLLGLSCAAKGDLLKVGNQKFPIYQLYTQKIRMIPLAPLVRAAGQTIVWNQAAKVATVYGGTGSLGWRAVRDKQLQSASIYHGPLRASQTAPKMGQPAVQQIIFADAPLSEVTFVSKTPNALTTVGSLTPSTPDNPNKTPACHPDNPKVCELPVPRDALWVLAFATTK